MKPAVQKIKLEKQNLCVTYTCAVPSVKRKVLLRIMITREDTVGNHCSRENNSQAILQFYKTLSVNNVYCQMDQKRPLQSVLLCSVISQYKGLCLPQDHVHSIFQTTLLMHFYLLEALYISGLPHTPSVQYHSNIQ